MINTEVLGETKEPLADDKNVTVYMPNIDDDFTSRVALLNKKNLNHFNVYVDRIKSENSIMCIDSSSLVKVPTRIKIKDGEVLVVNMAEHYLSKGLIVYNSIYYNNDEELVVHIMNYTRSPIYIKHNDELLNIKILK